MVCFVLDICVQNHKIRWSHEGRNFNEISFITLRTKALHCQHGKDRKTSGKIKIQEAKARKGKLIAC